MSNDSSKTNRQSLHNVIASIEQIWFCSDPIKTHIIASNHGNVGCMYSLAEHHKKENDNENMLKYLKMASENGFDRATELLIRYYHENKNYYEEAKCLELLYNSGNIKYKNYSFNIGYIYGFLGYDDLMVKYYDIKVHENKDHLSIKALAFLIKFYSEKHYNRDQLVKYLTLQVDVYKINDDAYWLAQIHDENKEYELAQKYYRIAAINGNQNAYYQLIRVEKYTAIRSKYRMCRNFFSNESTICLMCVIL